MDEVITRFAPSPTGYLHLGGIRTALINYIFTNQIKKIHSKSNFLLRIEDTDKNRSQQKYVESIINGLEWLGIKWDGEIYFQSKKIFRHQEIAYKLLETNCAFKCICSAEQIEKKRNENIKKKLNIKRLCNKCEFDNKTQKSKEDYCIRIKIPSNGNLLIDDLIQNKVELQNIEIDNFILLRQDSTPTYMLSSVVDDHDMNISTIIRGNDHFNNTFRQAYIYKQLEWEMPRFAHLPLIHGLDGSKLSKRHGAIDINEFRKLGYLPKAIINNLILLGWSPKNENEIIEIDEIIKKFEIKKISKSSSIFDYKKLDFFNYHYLQKNEGYIYFEKFIENNEILKTYLKKDKGKINDIFNIYKSKITKLSELLLITKVYFDNNYFTKPSEILDSNFNKLLTQFKVKLKKNKNWDESNLELIIKEFIKEKKIKFITFGKPMRYLLTNHKDGPSISSIISILGKDLTFFRVNNYLSNLKIHK